MVDKRGSERWREKEERTLKEIQRLKGMETMDGNEKEKKGGMVWAVTRLLSLLLFGSEML